MAGLKEIRTRIRSVKSTRQITSAMKMVAAAKLKKNQDRILTLRPYANKLHDLLAEVRANIDEPYGHPFMADRDPNRVLIVLVTSNRGLCGAFNANIMRKAMEVAENDYSEQWESGNVSFYAIGKKGHDFLKSQKLNIAGTEQHIFDKLEFEKAAEMSMNLADDFVSGTYDRVDFVYNSFKNAAVQVLTHERFLPVSMADSPSGFHSDYIFEPDRERLLNALIPKVLRIQFFKVLLDSFTAENGARMTAMHQATDNADELIRELTLHYNKARQAAITKEILDIVGGAEALR